MPPPSAFHPEPPLLPTEAHNLCRATVIIPARNEEDSLSATLEALRLQTDSHGTAVDPAFYETLLLLNNCTDHSAAVAHRYRQQHPAFRLHIVERILPPDIAHVGTARRLLMDTAWHRLRHTPGSAILSTDADTTVAPDWIAQNLRALQEGAEVVGGVIHLRSTDIANLDPGTLLAYRHDRRYQQNVARLESLLDPDPADPWPRHLEHFGASLACTPEVYARAGGLPPIKPLEDVAFIHACRRVDARIRHAPEVAIVTSARLEGRTEVGLSGQLRRWKDDSALNTAHLVQNAAYLTHRFSCLAKLRHLRELPRLPSLADYPHSWHKPVIEAHPKHLCMADFLAEIDCDRLIDETFSGPREGLIHRVIADLDRAITKHVPEHPAETSPAASIEQFATPVG